MAFVLFCCSYSRFVRTHECDDNDSHQHNGEIERPDRYIKHDGKNSKTYCCVHVRVYASTYTYIISVLYHFLAAVRSLACVNFLFLFVFWFCCCFRFHMFQLLCSLCARVLVVAGEYRVYECVCVFTLNVQWRWTDSLSIWLFRTSHYKCVCSLLFFLLALLYVWQTNARVHVCVLVARVYN